MAHFGQFTIKKEDNYKNMSDLITFEDGKTYTLQIQNPALIQSSSTEPTKGGFYINKPDIFTFTKKEGENLYIKAEAFFTVVNVAD